MDINPYADAETAIVTALSSILPIGHLHLETTAADYAIFRLYNRKPEAVGSGRNMAVGCYGDIDVFSTTNLSPKIPLITAALVTAKIKPGDVRDAEYDAGSKRFHTIIPFHVQITR